ncbi:MAG: DEAD/DEAH box helicase [Elusimicrobia bacterium]|nr:DEAD/DEAH box helicase [Elusimicrobiota bacterium]
MIILHAGFLRGRLFVWGEAPDGKRAEPDMLGAALRAAGIDRPLQFEAIAPGSEPAVPLETAEAVDFLAAGAGKSAAAQGALIGPDLAYWTSALEFCASLVVRQRVVQAYALENNRFRSYWKPIYTGSDEQAFRDLASRLPGGEVSPDAVLTEFIREIAGHLMRSGPKPAPSPGVPEPATGPFKLCFRLEEPEEPKGSWRVSFLLQSTSDPGLLLPPGYALGAGSGAPKILRREHFELREKLLAALDHAARICPGIRLSLEAAVPDGYDLDVHEAHEFLTLFAAPLEAAGFGVLLPAWWTRKGGRPQIAARARASRPGMQGASGFSLDDVIRLDWEVALGAQTLTREELDALAKLKEPLVRLRGRWVEASGDDIRTAMEFWKNKEKSTLRDLVRMTLGGAEAPPGLVIQDVAAEGELGRFLDRIQGKARYETLPPPKKLSGRLRPYQLRGFSWLAFLRQYGLGACLADDMGLGKTIQALALILSDREAGVRKPVLIACPLSVVTNWKKEAERFTPGLSVLVHHGVDRERAAAFKKSVGKHAVVVTSYALLARDFETLREIHWGGVILDEAQNVKNPQTLQSRAARALEADYRIALTGTPVENHVGDLWSIMEFLNPGLLGSQAEFKKSFLTPIESGDKEAAERLARLTRPFVLRRLKTDRSIIRDLPDKLEMKVFCNLTKEQAALYAAVGREAETAIEGAGGIQRRGLILAALTKLKQICDHPAHFLGDGSRLEGRSGKLARLCEMLEEVLESGERALVFTQYAKMGRMLQRHIAETFGREVLFLHGGVPRAERDLMVERFQAEGEGPAVFVLSLKAGGTGLNLTNATHVFHYDRWWNPAVENQATDRAHRIGQTRSVQVHKFICAGTLEEKIDAMLERKKEVAERVVGAGEGWLTELSNAELRKIFALSAEAVGD